MPAVQTRKAWGTALLLAVGVFVNYLDRVNLSVAFDALRRDWQIGDFQFGLLSSVYSWTYTALQLPMGWILDTLGVRLTGSLAALLWSLASFGAAWAPGVRTFIGARLVLGVAEAPTFPANAKAVAEWFPPEKRGLPTGMFDSAAKLGTAIGVPLLGLLLLRHGWRWSFAFTGVISAAYFLAFMLFYRDSERGLRGKKNIAGPGFRAVLRNRKVLALSLGFSGYGYSFYLFLTWLPHFLATSLGLDLQHSVLATAVPWAFAAVSSLVVGGWLVDRLIARGMDASRVRKTVMIAGMLLGVASLGAVHTHDPLVAVIWITVALSGLSASASVAWQVPALVSARGAEARAASVMNFANNSMAILAPIATGALLHWTGNFVAPMAAAAAMVLFGVGCYLAMGRIEQVSAV